MTLILASIAQGSPAVTCLNLTHHGQLLVIIQHSLILKAIMGLSSVFFFPQIKVNKTLGHPDSNHMHITNCDICIADPEANHNTNSLYC